MSEVYVAYDGGAHRCYRSVNGVDRHFVGCRHQVPSSAIAHARSLRTVDLAPYTPPERRGSPAPSESGLTSPDRVHADETSKARDRRPGRKAASDPRGAARLPDPFHPEVDR